MSDYPRIMYHRDGHSAVATSAHHEQTEFSGAEWSRTPDDKHLRDPGDGMLRTLAPAMAQTTPAPQPRHQDAPGPVSASDVRNIIAEAFANHPGLNPARTVNEVQPGEANAAAGGASGGLDALHAKIDRLMAELGVKAAGEPEEANESETSSRRRGRPRGNPDNRLTGAAGEQE